jgi:hypothetical protein
MIYNNLLMMGLREAGLAREGSAADQFGFQRNRMISPDWSLEGIAGLLGQGQASGFVQSDSGERIKRDVEHGSALSSIIADKADPQAYKELAGSTAGKILLTLADYGVDPMTWIGLGSGLDAVSKAKSVKTGIDILRRAGVADDVIKGFIKGRLGRSPTFLEALAGAEDPYDFFRKGWLFNRNPKTVVNAGKAVERAAEAVPEVVRAQKEGRLPVAATPSDRVSELLNVMQQPETRGVLDDLLARQGGRAGPAKTRLVLDAMPVEQMYEETGKMVAKYGLRGDAAEEIVQDAIVRAYESLKDMIADPAKNALRKIRSTLKGAVQHAIREVKRHPAGVTGIPKNLAPEAVEFAEDVRYSLRNADTAGREAIAASIRQSPHVRQVEDLPDGMRITMKNGMKCTIRFVGEIETPTPHPSPRRSGRVIRAGAILNGIQFSERSVTNGRIQSRDSRGQLDP